MSSIMSGIVEDWAYLHFRLTTEILQPFLLKLTYPTLWNRNYFSLVVTLPYYEDY